MSKKRMEINGEFFEVVKPRKYAVNPVSFSRWDCQDIYAAYDRPSTHKVSIWNYWRNWKDTCDTHFFTGFRIVSHNTFTFTINANVWDEKTGEFIGIIVITKDYNRIYLA